MMAIDMGGPINKASYVTATALLTSSGAAGSDVMAATMLGGMIPPLATVSDKVLYTIFKILYVLYKELLYYH